MTKYNENFSENLKKLRNERGLNQRQLAELLGYSEKTVSKWECGACVPNIEVLFELSKIFQIGIEELFCDNPFYFLGIDGGGTKTDFALADADGNVVRTYKSGSCNPMDIGIDESMRILKEGIYKICANIPFSHIFCFAGISGGTSGDMQGNLKLFFAEFGFKNFCNDTDIKNIIASGLGDNDGITVILGTGICLYTQKNNEHKKIAGWGYLIDNGGSGYNLGRDALNAYFCAFDGSGPETLITKEIEKAYPDGVQKVMGYIYSGGKKAVASFAPIVFEAVKKGDKVAENILKRNLNVIVRLIETAGKEFDNKRIPVVLAGGLVNQRCVVEGIKNALKSDGRFEVEILENAPVYGAVKQAMKLIGQETEK